MGASPERLELLGVLQREADLLDRAFPGQARAQAELLPTHIVRRHQADEPVGVIGDQLLPERAGGQRGRHRQQDPACR